MIADIVAIDRDDEPILVAEVKAVVLEPDAADAATEQVRKMMAALGLAFGMLLDLEKILVLRSDGDHPGPVLELKTVDVLRSYDPDVADKFARSHRSRIFHDYVVTLAEGWLRDLAYRWNSKTPPGIQELAELGLLERLAGGFTQSEVQIGGAALR